MSIASALCAACDARVGPDPSCMSLMICRRSPTPRSSSIRPGAGAMPSTTVGPMASPHDDSGLDEHGESPFPGARRPDRTYDLPAHGVRIAVHEWGAADAPAADDDARRIRLRAHLRRLRPEARRRRLARRVLGPARPRQQRARIALLVGRRHARHARRVRPRRRRSTDPRGRTLEGRRADDATRRCSAPSVPLPGQHGRHPVQAEHARPGRARAHHDARQGPGRMARPSTRHGERQPQARHTRRPGPAPRADEPAAPTRVAASARHDRRLRVRRTGGDGRSTRRCVSADSVRGDPSGC